MGLDILLVEDAPSDAELIRRALFKSGLECALRTVATRPAFLSELDAGRPDLVISDHTLPQFSGREVLQITRALRDPPPLILVTGSLDEETAVAYMREGAADYVLKDRLTRLGPAVEAALQRDLDRRERERADVARRQTEERLSLLVRATNDAIWDLDVSTGTMEVNEGFRALIGLGAGSGPLTLERWHARIHEADRTRVADGLHAALDGRASYWTDDYRLRVADGTYALVLDRGYVMRDAGGRPVRVIGALVDVTERRRLQEQLQHAQKMEAIGRLAGGIAHDFNNVLAGILMSTDLILNGGVTGDAIMSDLREVHAAAERAANLTRQLLAFSRKQVITLRNIDLNETVASFSGMLRRLLGEDIRLVQRLLAPHATVRADAGQIEQIVLNLAVNARDAMPAGGTLIVETGTVERTSDFGRDDIDLAPGSYVVLSVADTGQGVPPAIRDRIFDPFFTTKEAGKGTGLGLSTVYGIVRQHGGQISVDSEPGIGTTFRIYLPSIEGPPESGPVAARDPDRLDGSETILLVEDEPRVRDLTRRILERRGYTVLAAADGVSALELAARHDGRFDLLITDVILPGPSGPAVAERILESGYDGPVLFLSGYSEEAVTHEGRLRPRAHFLGKPFTPDTLAKAVRHALEGRRRVSD